MFLSLRILRLLSSNPLWMKKLAANYSNYSQPERRVSSSQLTKNADIILRRTGVNSVSKSYKLDDLGIIPNIGEAFRISKL